MMNLMTEDKERKLIFWQNEGMKTEDQQKMLRLSVKILKSTLGHLAKVYLMVSNSLTLES